MTGKGVPAPHRHTPRRTSSTPTMHSTNSPRLSRMSKRALKEREEDVRHGTAALQVSLCVALPSHASPPCSGSFCVRVRVRVPNKHE